MNAVKPVSHGRGYSEEEINSIYELGRLSAEAGNLSRAEALARGLTEVAPEFSAAWVLLCYTDMIKKEYDAAIFSSRQALRVDPSQYTALLFLICASMHVRDYHSAGSLLGEFSEKVEAGLISDKNAVMG
jgi:tetratricopeptide (TPR) repeat protein